MIRSVLALTFLSFVACANGNAAPKSSIAVLETNKGKITIRLFEDKAPISTKNFLSYVDSKFYEGVIFHRVIDGFMVQGGGFDQSFKKKNPKPPIKNEADNGMTNRRGTLSMARTNVVDSATSQFFINLVDNKRLDHAGPSSFGYAVFGEVIDGMGVVDAIAKSRTLCPSNVRAPCNEQLPPGMRDVPAEAIVITKAYRKK